MKKGEYTKKQKEEISGLVCMLDELDNKPRRLYEALKDFAHAFLDKDGKSTALILKRLDQAEKAWYTQWNFEGEVASMLNGIRRRADDLTSSVAEEKFSADYRRSHEDVTEDQIKKAWRRYHQGANDMRDSAMQIVLFSVYPELDVHYSRYE